MSFEEDKYEVETAHILVNDFVQSIKDSKVEITPEVLSAVLMKKAGEILLEIHREYVPFRKSVDRNFTELNKLFIKKNSSPDDY